MALTPGTRLGHYEIVAPLGAGGMGEVYRARDVRLERDVALKILPPGAVSDESARKRFRKEALALSRLNHPNIATVLDFDSQDSVDFLVMEHVAGEGIAEKVASGPLAEREIARLGLELAEGIAAAHGQGVIHRDLKPGNLRLMPDGRLKILDFGIAQLLESSSPEVAATTQTFSATAPGVTAGTPAYMAPERLHGERADARSDIWGVGLVLYELATGRRAFPAGDSARLITAILHEAPPSPTAVNRRVSASLENIIAKCLEKDPENRYQSAKDLAVDLRRLGGISPGVGTRAGSSLSKRLIGRVGMIAVFALISLLLVWGGASLQRQKKMATQPSADLASLVVLPLRNLSGDPSQDYVANGITESLMAALAQTPGLLVLDRNSISGYQGHPVDPRLVGRELGARYLLDGSFQRTGDQLRVSARLVETSTSRSLWTGQVDQKTNDLFALQDEIARRVATALRPVLPAQVHTSMAERRPAGPPTQNSEAYDLFLKASYLSRKDTRESRQEAHELLLRAVAIDPGFALAHARLGFIAAHQYFYDEPRAEWEQQAFVSIEKALALDPRQAEAYVARAKLVWSLPKGFQHEPAMRDLLHAIELEPNSMTAHHWLGIVTLHLGLYERSAAEFRLVLRLDPTNTFAPGYLAWIDCELGRPELALQAYERNPNLKFGPDDALLLMGRLDEARRRIEADLATAPDDGGNLARYALVLAKAGDVAQAETMLRRAAQHLPNLGHIHHAKYDLARAYAVLDRRPEALLWMERTAHDGMPNHRLFATDPFLTSLRGYPPFEAFLARVKIQHDYYLALIEGRSKPSL